jgi:hypothetical protein
MAAKVATSSEERSHLSSLMATRALQDLLAASSPRAGMDHGQRCRPNGEAQDQIMEYLACRASI